VLGHRVLGCIVPLALAGGSIFAQQVADSTYDVSIEKPTYPPGSGPVVAIDAAHNNFHTADGRYRPLARLLENDGYRVRSNDTSFTRLSLDSIDILIIANAIGGALDAGAYERPGFTDGEVTVVEEWVKGGGSLLLIADHAPMGVAAEILARRFGVEMSKGYTEDSTSYFNIGGFGTSVLLYSRASGLLNDHPINRGLDSVVAYTGQSLSGPDDAEPLLVLSPGAFDHPSPTAEQAARGMPGTAWRTAVIGLPTTPAAGRAQGLAIRVEKGRVVVLGEAAMLSAQAVFNAQGERLGIAGMNVPGTGNRQFTLNVMHWLSGRL
jgi:hypothetical protein